MKVIDNFLPSVYQDVLEKALLGYDFPWYLYNGTLLPEDVVTNINTTDGIQFIHKVVLDGVVHSPYYSLISTIAHHLMLTENIDTTNTVRIKCNLNVPINGYVDGHHFPAHYDSNRREDITVAIYYVNDSDGDTILFDSKTYKEVGRVTPKKGRLVYFNGDTLHAGEPPKINQTRCLINFNFNKVKNAS